MLDQTVDVTKLLMILRGSKDGQAWEKIVVDKNSQDNPKLIDDLIDMGVEVFNSGDVSTLEDEQIRELGFI